jgi:hypothetical protein
MHHLKAVNIHVYLVDLFSCGGKNTPKRRRNVTRSTVWRAPPHSERGHRLSWATKVRLAAVSYPHFLCDCWQTTLQVVSLPVVETAVCPASVHYASIMASLRTRECNAAQISLEISDDEEVFHTDEKVWRPLKTNGVSSGRKCVVPQQSLRDSRSGVLQPRKSWEAQQNGSSGNLHGQNSASHSRYNSTDIDDGPASPVDNETVCGNINNNRPGAFCSRPILVQHEGQRAWSDASRCKSFELPSSRPPVPKLDRQTSIVDELLFEIYDRWHGGRHDSFDSDTFTECSSTSEFFHSRWDSCNEQKLGVQYNRSYLESQSKYTFKFFV